jgi:hypothetical protein
MRKLVVTLDAMIRTDTAWQQARRRTRSDTVGE